MNAIYYDTEFIEDGRTIDLISIGMVAEDGREYYAVNSEMPLKRIFTHEWLMKNVVPSLPVHDPHSIHLFTLDTANTDVKPRFVIANEVRDFIQATLDPQLWAWYAAYDHVALCQLWGTMTGLPKGVPMYTCDLKQECDRLGNPQMPGQTEGEHNALADARHVKVMAEFLRGRP